MSRLKIIEAQISPDDVLEFNSNVPFNVQYRLLLGKRGIRFADDGYLSSATNENPKPLGKIEKWLDPKTNVTHYKQTILLPRIDEHA